MVMRFDRTRLLLAACSTLTLVACGSAAGQHGSNGPPATRVPASARSTPARDTCGPPPPRHAWAVDVTTTGRTLWKTPLETRGNSSSPAVPPVAVGPVAVFAQDGIVHGIRLADGHPLWSWPGGQSVYGLWRRGGLVAVLTDQVSNHARLTGYDERTGRPRWTIPGGVPPYPAVQVVRGLVLVTSNATGPSIPNTLTAVVPATGRVAWRFDPPTPATDPGAPASVLSAGPAGLAVATYDPRRLYLLDLRTGRPRWHADTFVTQGMLPLVTGASVILTEGQNHVAVVARDAVNGRVRWRDAVPGPSEGYQSVLAAGPLAILQGEPGDPGSTAQLRAYQMAGGRLAWQVGMPAFVQAPAVLVPGGILVQPADLAYACAVAQ